MPIGTGGDDSDGRTPPFDFGTSCGIHGWCASGGEGGSGDTGGIDGKVETDPAYADEAELFAYAADLGKKEWNVTVGNPSDQVAAAFLGTPAVQAAVDDMALGDVRGVVITDANTKEAWITDIYRTDAGIAVGGGVSARAGETATSPTSAESPTPVGGGGGGGGGGPPVETGEPGGLWDRVSLAAMVGAQRGRSFVGQSADGMAAMAAQIPAMQVMRGVMGLGEGMIRGGGLALSLNFRLGGAMLAETAWAVTDSPNRVGRMGAAVAASPKMWSDGWSGDVGRINAAYDQCGSNVGAIVDLVETATVVSGMAATGQVVRAGAARVVSKGAVRAKIGSSVAPMERTLDMALNPTSTLRPL